jgi:hypothetical protein
MIDETKLKTPIDIPILSCPAGGHMKMSSFSPVSGSKNNHATAWEYPLR